MGYKGSRTGGGGESWATWDRVPGAGCLAPVRRSKEREERAATGLKVLAAKGSRRVWGGGIRRNGDERLRGKGTTYGRAGVTQRRGGCGR